MYFRSKYITLTFHRKKMIMKCFLDRLHVIVHSRSRVVALIDETVETLPL